MTLKVKVPIGTDINQHFVYPTPEFIREFAALGRTADAVDLTQIRADLAALLLRVSAIEEELARLRDSYQS